MSHRNETLGELAAMHPAATHVFLRNRLDFCCRGNRTLAHACEQAGLDVNTVERELDAAAAAKIVEPRWETRSPDELTRHIEARYHEALRRDVPSLIDAARKVERVHRDKPAVPAGLAELLAAFWTDMQRHMDKEEQVLFPLLRRGAHGGMIAGPICVMEDEHDDHGRALSRIRELTGDLQAPAHACATWRALYDGLATLEADLMQHIHLENNVLFRRAVG